MASLCEGGNEPPVSLKASYIKQVNRIVGYDTMSIRYYSFERRFVTILLNDDSLILRIDSYDSLLLVVRMNDSFTNRPNSNLQYQMCVVCVLCVRRVCVVCVLCLCRRVRVQVSQPYRRTGESPSFTTIKNNREKYVAEVESIALLKELNTDMRQSCVDMFGHVDVSMETEHVKVKCELHTPTRCGTNEPVYTTQVTNRNQLTCKIGLPVR
ncbi:hypothetical protein ANN_09072 [Periplaneta americana]|uniref:Uncharacterized protein n=1 Tax=Periplaneta americana TaxID=6978 RepID=A0ABQ8TLC7_PERAM|nr:hypothetical protein ANN_09072 [Periplaneta americana]